jgi:hypothetical protein
MLGARMREKRVTAGVYTCDKNTQNDSNGIITSAITETGPEINLIPKLMMKYCQILAIAGL